MVNDSLIDRTPCTTCGSEPVYTTSEGFLVKTQAHRPECSAAPLKPGDINATEDGVSMGCSDESRAAVRSEECLGLGDRYNNRSKIGSDYTCQDAKPVLRAGGHEVNLVESGDKLTGVASEISVVDDKNPPATLAMGIGYLQAGIRLIEAADKEYQKIQDGLAEIANTPPEPVSVSLEKCVEALADSILYAENGDIHEYVKAVLDAAGVAYHG